MNMKFTVLLVVFSLLSGCASITRGTSEDFAIESDPDGATATLSTGQMCTTPCTMELRRKHGFSMVIEKDGYSPVTAKVEPRQAGAGTAGMVGNVIFGGIVGVVVDANSGAMKDLYPNPLVVKLELVGSSEMSRVVGDMVEETRPEDGEVTSEKDDTVILEKDGAKTEEQ